MFFIFLRGDVNFQLLEDKISSFSFLSFLFSLFYIIPLFLFLCKKSILNQKNSPQYEDYVISLYIVFLYSIIPSIPFWIYK